MPSYPKVSDDLEVQLHYEHCRRQGTSHALAEMFAYQRPPQSDTDREFMMNTANGRQFQDRPEIGNAYKKKAESMGQNVTGKKYISQLAEFPGDPRAWVSGKGDVQKLAEEKGWNVSGKVNVKARREGPPPVPVDVAEDIVQDEVAKIVAAAPDPRDVKIEDVREKVIQKRRPPWKTKAVKRG